MVTLNELYIGHQNTGTKEEGGYISRCNFRFVSVAGFIRKSLMLEKNVLVGLSLVEHWTALNTFSS